MEKHSPRAKKPGRKHTGAHRTGNRSSSAMKSKAVLHKRWLLGTVAAVYDRRRSRNSWTVGGCRPPLQIVLVFLALLFLFPFPPGMPEQAKLAGAIALAPAKIHVAFPMGLCLRSRKLPGYF